MDGERLTDHAPRCEPGRAALPPGCARITTRPVILEAAPVRLQEYSHSTTKPAVNTRPVSRSMARAERWTPIDPLLGRFGEPTHRSSVFSAIA